MNVKRTLCTLLGAAAFAAPLAATAAPVSFPYGSTPTIVCTPLFVCDLTLQPGERILNLAIGDSTRWIVSPAESGSGENDTPHVLIKPTDTGLATNVVVTTTKHTYAIDLRSARSGAMEQVNFVYPPDPKPPAPPPTPAPLPTPTFTPAPKIDRSYTVSGDRRLTPAEVYNDGTDTYVRFAAQLQQLPALVAIGANGDELVNYRVVDGDQYVVAGLPAQLALINGSGKKQQRLTITRR